MDSRIAEYILRLNRKELSHHTTRSQKLGGSKDLPGYNRKRIIGDGTIGYQRNPPKMLTVLDYTPYDSVIRTIDYLIVVEGRYGKNNIK